MTLLHDLIAKSTRANAAATALYFADRRLRYDELADLVEAVANGLLAAGLERRDRVGIFLPKCFETVAAMFGTSLAGGVFVPINPVLKAAQVEHILRDSGARVLITSAARLDALENALPGCPTLRMIVSVDGAPRVQPQGVAVTEWSAFVGARPVRKPAGVDADIAAILYTSGSTGKPKGVVLTQRNMVCGAESVADYLGNRPSDRLLAVLPFSFDYGFSQLSTAFLAGASVALIEYLMPRDILTGLTRYEITGLGAVPPLWIQLASLDWPPSIARTLRYVTNSGGAMPTATLAALRRKVPSTAVFLMYGLTEAFRSTYLPPDQVDVRPTSIGKAIPNAEIIVVRPDGTLCAPREPGELVHRGALVSRGYWNDPEKTAVRFKPAPLQPAELTIPEVAVWSGDTVMTDEEGYLYFVGRRDEMIKTSGYRVSPTEVEEVVYATGLVTEAVVVGAPHPVLGQAVVVIGVSARASAADTDELLAACSRALPTFMVPVHVEWRDALPRNANGKIDRPTLAAAVANLYGDRK
jgi:acyl-CoA ligase (AMP-forming) (exosortase A-associated)